MPPIPADLGLLLAVASTLNLWEKTKTRPYRPCETPQSKEASQLCKMPSTFRPSNLLLQEAHLATRRITWDISSSREDETPLKILSFLSFQINQSTAKGTSLQIISPPLEKKERIPKSQAYPRKSSESNILMPHLGIDTK